MKRSEILEAARRCVCGEREQDYGTPENNFETIGLLWGVYLRAGAPGVCQGHAHQRHHGQGCRHYAGPAQGGPHRHRLQP